MIQTRREVFNRGYVRGVSPTLLVAGEIADGKNVRLVNKVGGWRPRGGASQITTATTANMRAVSSFKSKLQGDWFLLSQANGDIYKRLLIIH